MREKNIANKLIGNNFQHIFSYTLADSGSLSEIDINISKLDHHFGRRGRNYFNIMEIERMISYTLSVIPHRIDSYKYLH